MAHPVAGCVEVVDLVPLDQLLFSILPVRRRVSAAGSPHHVRGEGAEWSSARIAGPFQGVWLAGAPHSRALPPLRPRGWAPFAVSSPCAAAWRRLDYF